MTYAYQTAGCCTKSSILRNNQAQHRVSTWPYSHLELIDDCIQNSINSRKLSEERLEFVNRFHEYLSDCHTHENLAFLIDVSRYEYLYEAQKLQSLGIHGITSTSLWGDSLQGFIEKFPCPNAAMGSYLHKGSMKTPSSSSLNSGSTIAPFELDSVISSPSPDPFDTCNFLSTDSYAQALDSDWDSRTGSGFDLGTGSGLNSGFSSDLPQSFGLDYNSLLLNQFHSMIAMYIDADAPCEINLSNKVSRELLECYRSASFEVPNPLVIAEAKKEATRLIHENAYYPFMKMMSSQNLMNSSCQSSLPFAKLPLSSSCETKVLSFQNEVQRAPPVKPLLRKRRSRFLSPFSDYKAGAGESGKNAANPSRLSNISTLFKSASTSNLFYSNGSTQRLSKKASVLSCDLSASSNFSTEEIIPGSCTTFRAKGHKRTSIFTKLWRKIK